MPEFLEVDNSSVGRADDAQRQPACGSAARLSKFFPAPTIQIIARSAGQVKPLAVRCMGLRADHEGKLMPHLLFMPWCHLDRKYQVGDITLIPFAQDQKAEGMDALGAAYARLILRSYKNKSGLPVRNSVLARYKDRGLLTDLTPEEQTAAFEFGQIGALAGLANREFFKQLGNYCNADCFRMYGQPFKDEPSFSAISCRRVGGRSTTGISLSELSISVPVHVDSQKIKLDEGLAQAICSHRVAAEEDEWSRWQNAISCFNQAETDDSASMYQVEWVLLCSAFEHLLNADPKADDVAQKFSQATQPIRTIPAMTSCRKLDRWRDEGQPLRHEWMKEFYRVRGDFAHGRLETRQPTGWKLHEHLFLAALAFPILVRCVLQVAGRYVFTEEDKRQLWAFEAAADGDCFAQISDPESGVTMLWPKLLSQARFEQAATRAQRKIEEHMNAREDGATNG